MKFLHTSDWHLGRMLYGRSLLPDQQHFIREQFLPLAEREKPDAVLLAGDVYDRSVAPAAAIALFDEVLTRLAELNIPLLVISGNHDGAARMAVGASLCCGKTEWSLPHDLRIPFSPVFWKKTGKWRRFLPCPGWMSPQPGNFWEKRERACEQLSSVWKPLSGKWKGCFCRVRFMCW